MILKLDTTLPTCHPGDYYTNSRSLYFTLLNNPIMFIPELLKIDPVYPPLLYVSPFYFYCFGGYGYDTAILAISILYLSLLVIFLYLIGAHLFNREVGLLSVILCSFFPGIFGYSRMFLMALPSVALSMINVYVMIRSDCFRIKKYSLLFGLFLGLGMLMVKYYAVLLLGLSLGYLFDHMNIITHEKKRICFNLLLTFGIAIVIALPWYAVSMRYIFAQCQEAKHVVFFGRKAVFDFFSYSKHLIDYQIGIFFFSIFIISFGYLLVKRKLSRMMILWIMWPYV
ncbi:MAG: glycosyltransferase family 39 protein, partial [Candidatus Omnitrophica bacterium]|nr:glycosyltransferase family 39 protein [Candidatus Omnitrophota bacterium]